ncbi:unnamed protein product [Notodromas monacha]|uniref:DOMON domain-containing protein n=1 Tax=Notodromas monacha TaxID=399045 RepID=A0A7R9GK43_9CRUS|nr:unnamed protein product [Notodromas monacha]CAG0924235.1 unnamed protein product [Notodromas monacha]
MHSVKLESILLTVAILAPVEIFAQSLETVPPGFIISGNQIIDPAKGSKVRFWWGYNETDPSELFFVVSARAKGYVGIGFNNRGGMKGADMVLGWITSNGTVIFEDRFGNTDFSAPVVDKEQNVKLEMAKENATHTMFAWTRPAKTSDTSGQDLQINNEMIEVLWAYTDEDPVGAPVMHTERGHMQLNLVEKHPTLGKP